MTRKKSSAARILSAFYFAFFVLFWCLRARAVVAHDVTTDYSRFVDFSMYQSFMWIKEPAFIDPALKRQIVEGINAQLESKGLHLVTDHADLEISANVATGEKYTLSSFYEDFPACWNWHHNMGPGSPSKLNDFGKEDTYKPGTLVVDLFSVQQKSIVWWSVSNKFIYETAPEGPKHIAALFDEMFSGNQWWTTTP